MLFAMQATLEELVTHKYGHRLLLHLIAPAHLGPHIVALVHPALDSSLTAEVCPAHDVCFFSA